MAEIFYPTSLNYVFFTSLKESEIYKHEFSTLNSKLTFEPNGISRDSTRMKNALTFLSDAKNAARNQEIAAIKYFKEQIERKFGGNGNVPEAIQDSLDAIDKGEENMSRIVIAFRALRQRVDEYKRLLQEKGAPYFEAQAQKMAESFILAPQLQQDTINIEIAQKKTGETESETLSVARQMYTEIRGIIDAQLGDQIKQVATTIASYLPKYNLQQIVQLLYTAIFIDYSFYISNSITPESINAILEQAVQPSTFNDYLSNKTLFSQYMANPSQYIEQLKHSITSLQDQLGIQILNRSMLATMTKTVNAAKKDQKKSSKDTRWFRNAKKIAKATATKQKDAVTVKFHTKQSHGFMNETILTIFQRAVNVKANVGIDNIVELGEVKVEFPSLLPNLNDALTNHFNALKKKDNPLDGTIETNIEYQKKLTGDISDAIRAAIKERQQELSEIDGIIDEFISYETLKLYTQKVGDSLSGRSMVIENALGKIGAGLSADGLTPADIISLKPYILNLTTSTLGGNNKYRLEKYLSYFAALLMFDDLPGIINPVVEAAEHIQVHQLYIYNFQNQQYPLSVVLEYLLKYFKDLSNRYEDAFYAEITQPENLNISNAGTSATTETAWNTIRDYTWSNTKLELHMSWNMLAALESLF